LANSIAEKLRKHWIWWALGLISTIVVSTWKVAHELYVIPLDNEVNRLTQRIAELEKRKIILYAPGEESVNQEEITQSQESHLKGWVQKGHLFEPRDPYPKSYDKIKIGTHLSVLKHVYPSARYYPTKQIWGVDMLDSPFYRVLYKVSTIDDSPDPKITSLVFLIWSKGSSKYADQDARKYITDQALLAFGSDTVKSKMAGEELKWSDIEGTKIRINPYQYMLSKAKE
jgi:hypothetical protein